MSQVLHGIRGGLKGLYSCVKCAKQSFLAAIFPFILKPSINLFFQVITPLSDSLILLDDSSGKTVPKRDSATHLNEDLVKMFSGVLNKPLPKLGNRDYPFMFSAIVDISAVTKRADNLYCHS